MVQISDLKNSLRIDHNFDDDLFQQLLDTATQYIISAIDSKAETSVIAAYKQFDWAVSLLTQHWYENRDTPNSDRMPVTVQALIQQMRGAYYADYKKRE
ncbi:head-tail connector protein [Enterococcus sp. S86.2]|uniref:head-tail connector protein n=1 Tax=Enterococcus sp. S86.2 TaxID=3031299 RepID=UPI0026ED9103|nr:head-tail connector protein [Enterococcus sp. S86.2]